MADAAVQAPEPGHLVRGDVVRLWPRVAPAAFEAGLSRLAAPTAVVACNGSDGPSGVLASSLATVSANPPRLLFSVDKSAAAHKALLAAERVSISLLGADQRQLARAFSGEARNEFDPSSWRLDPAAPPELPAAVAAFVGPVRCRIDAGAATLFIVDVATTRSRDGASLVRLSAELHAIG